MSEEILENAESVNQHYLEKVMDLAEEKDIAATEDIFNAKGMKLIAKGAKISRALQEKLILHKLKKPLEACIAVEGGVDVKAIVAEARRIAAQNEAIGCILTATSSPGISPFDILAGVPLGNAMGLMLTITERGGPTALTHCAMVSLVSICLANKLGLGEKEQTTVAIAGLLHDIGELYIQPEYLNPKRRLLPHEWNHVVVHPRVGQMLVEQHGNYPAAVALAVSEHHERFDGAGYPRQAFGKNISIPGQILAVAEMISGVFMRQDRPLERAELAMKIMPGEHARYLVSIISSVARVPHSNPAPPEGIQHEELHQRTRVLFDRISLVQQTGQKLAGDQTLRSTKGKDLLYQVLERANIIQRAFSSTGLDACLLEDAIEDASILFEVEVATREIQWRLRDVARELFLRASALESQEMAIFQPLVTLLDEGN